MNRDIENGSFPGNLKNTDITPTFKEEYRLLKANHRPVSNLATLWKAYEKLIYSQIYESFNLIYLGGFRTGHNTRRSLIYMLEELKEIRDSTLLNIHARRTKGDKGLNVA